MGGTKSKPIADTARVVMTRRNKDAPPLIEKIIAPEIMQTAKAVPPVVNRKLDNLQEEAFSEDALKMMNSWGGYQSTKNFSAKEIYTPKVEMASMVRYEEERLNIKESEGIPGRLSESQVNTIYTHLRNGHKSYAQIAEEFEVSEENISQLSIVARFPIICTDGKSPELFAK
mmetsp:Transcript_26542/g.25401  ORF Transcript_26542/g.25401 Transcript_26542/m.25401 type:complete len:172 (-) Transcript_26542:202-717(-)